MDSKVNTQDLDQIIKHLKECKVLPEGQVKSLCEKVIFYILLI